MKMLATYVAGTFVITPSDWVGFRDSSSPAVGVTIGPPRRRVHPQHKHSHDCEDHTVRRFERDLGPQPLPGQADEQQKRQQRGHAAEVGD